LSTYLQSKLLNILDRRVEPINFGSNLPSGISDQIECPACGARLSARVSRVEK
jgi:hypothetical protein